jgi:CDP-glucose 4,6-dehydratase
MADRGFWAGKRVFVTGHTGFKGSWLSIWLHALGAEVTGYALPPPTDPSLYDLCRVDRMVRSVIADVRDADRLAAAVAGARPEIVFHLAAQPIVRESYRNPVETYATNVLGTAHLLQAVRSCGDVKAFVNVTSDKCYENREWAWGYRECEPLGGYDPYSSSKACSELVTAAYRASFFNPADPSGNNAGIATARAGNVIGGGDFATDRLLPDCIRAILKESRSVFEIPRRHGRGNTFSSRCPGTSSWRGSSTGTTGRSPARGTSAPTTATSGPCRGSSTGSAGSGAAAPPACRTRTATPTRRDP